MKIAVSIGHTFKGVDSGAIGLLNESICTREIGPLVDQFLRELGHETVLCRIDSAATVDESLEYRINKANAAGVDLFAEIHLNSGGGVGVETYALKPGGQGEAYAKKIQAALVELGYRNRGVKFANYKVLRDTHASAVLIECGFVDSQEDCNRYDPDKIARKIVKGITGVEPSATTQTVQTPAVKPENTIVVYGNEVDAHAAAYVAYKLKAEFQDGNKPKDYSTYSKVICVGGNPSNFEGKWTCYATDFIKGTDRYDTLLKALKFAGIV